MYLLAQNVGGEGGVGPLHNLDPRVKIVVNVVADEEAQSVVEAKDARLLAVENAVLPRR